MTHASRLPFGFTEDLIARQLDPTDLVSTPDGRLFITIKSGKILIVENNILLEYPLLNIESVVDNYNERGLGHIVLDPQFDTNGYYYLYYSVKNENHNRVSRFKATGNSSDPGEEDILLNLENTAGSVHNGGDMAFGMDGKLYISVGDGSLPVNAQSMTSLLGKVLRINTDGSAPEDNPFYTPTGGVYNAIWALGLRNPFSMDVQAGTGKIFVSDVGSEVWEEVNEVQAGKNYGWPILEGRRSTQIVPENYLDPLYSYTHGNGMDQGCAIIGAAFYNPAFRQFPEEYAGKFFFGDYCNSYIKYLDPVSGVVTNFITEIYSLVAVHIASDGSLYYLARGSRSDNTSSSDGALWRVNYTGNGLPHISASPQARLVAAGGTTTLTVTASGNEPLIYQWQEDSIDITGAHSSEYTIVNAQLTDNGKKVRCIVTNNLGSDTSNYAILNVISGTLPVPSLSTIISGGGSQYKGGDTLSFVGSATDVEDGVLPPSALSWKIDFHHGSHVHPALETFTGADSVSYIIPQAGEVSDNVWYRVYLTASDNHGLANTIYQEIFPLKANITFETEPPGFEIILDGHPVTTPYVFTGVVNTERSVEATLSVTKDDKLYIFDHWSVVESERMFTFKVPGNDHTFLAIYAEVSEAVVTGNAEMPATVTVYPTLAGEYINVPDPEANIYGWIIINSVGKKVKEGSMLLSSVIDIRDIPPGAYVLILSNEEAVRFMKKR